jgi:hypothetical protein
MRELVFQLPHFNLLPEERYLLVLDALKDERAVQQLRHFQQVLNPSAWQRTRDFGTRRFPAKLHLCEKLVEFVNLLGFFSVDLLVEDGADPCYPAYLTGLTQERQETGKALEYAQVFLIDSPAKELIPQQEAPEVNACGILDALEKRSNLIEVG